MATTTEIQGGKAKIYGIGGAITITGIATFNLADVTLTESFKEDTIPSQDGSIIETRIASQRVRELTITFAPSGATRAAAEAVLETLLAQGPLTVITLGGFTFLPANGTWNYMGGANVALRRDTYVVAGIKLKQVETAVAGVFGGLAVAT